MSKQENLIPGLPDTPEKPVDCGKKAANVEKFGDAAKMWAPGAFLATAAADGAKKLAARDKAVKAYEDAAIAWEAKEKLELDAIAQAKKAAEDERIKAQKASDLAGEGKRLAFILASVTTGFN